MSRQLVRRYVSRHLLLAVLGPTVYWGARKYASGPYMESMHVGVAKRCAQASKSTGISECAHAAPLLEKECSWRVCEHSTCDRHADMLPTIYEPNTAFLVVHRAVHRPQHALDVHNVHD